MQAIDAKFHRHIGDRSEQLSCAYFTVKLDPIAFNPCNLSTSKYTTQNINMLSQLMKASYEPAGHEESASHRQVSSPVPFKSKEPKQLDQTASLGIARTTAY